MLKLQRHEKKKNYITIGILFVMIMMLNIGSGLTIIQQDEIQVEKSQNSEITSEYVATASNANLGDDYFEISMAPKTGMIPSEAQAAYEFNNPTIGNVSVLVIPVYFPDEFFGTSTSTIQDRWDAEANSAQTYYWQNSLNKLNISVEVLEWTVANNTIAYYGDDDYQYPREFDLVDYLVEALEGIIGQ